MAARSSSIVRQIIRNNITMAEQLVHLQDIERLSPNVVRVLAQNPSQMTLQGTNCYILHSSRESSPSSSSTLIDTGSGEPSVRSFLPLLKRALKEERLPTIDRIVLTHWHPDHVGGLEGVLKAGLDDENGGFIDRHRGFVVQKFPNELNSRDASQAPPQTLAGWSDKDIEKIIDRVNAWDGSDPVEGIRYLSVTNADEDRPLAAPDFRIIHTPGHTNDSICLVTCDEEGNKVIFTGDTVLGQGTTVFTDLKDYMSSLQSILDERPDILYPAHGPPIIGVEACHAKLSHYLSHRLERERQIVDALRSDTLGGRGDVASIVRVVYRTEGEGVWRAAERPVMSHLVKLERDGKVKRTTKAADGCSEVWELTGKSGDDGGEGGRREQARAVL